MNALLIIVAECWRYRHPVGVPALLGALLAAFLLFTNPPLYTGRVLLQLQADQARAPLLQQISAPGHRRALWGALTAPDVLADSAPGILITPNRVELRVLNNYLLEVGLSAPKAEGLATMTENLGYNFIQALLAPERMRVEQLLAEAQADLVRMEALPAPLDVNLGQQYAQATGAVAQLQSDLRLLNAAFGQPGGQALLWFAEGARVEQPLQGLPRWLLGLLIGAIAGGSIGWTSYRLPRRWQPVIDSVADAQAVTGLPVVGVLPWLNQLTITSEGSRVNANGKALKPAEFAEITRLARAALRSLRGPLVVVAPVGSEGASTLALLLAEKAAVEGKTALLADLNLKNRNLSQQLLLGDGAWALPTTKGPWGALRVVAPKLHALAAPRHAATLQALADQGGLPALFEVLNKQAEVVIVDTSPLNATNRGNIDAVTLATHAGRTILVAEQGRTHRNALKQAADQLLLSGAAVQGVVLNQRFAPSRRQLLGHLADCLGWACPPLGRGLRTASYNATLD